MRRDYKAQPDFEEKAAQAEEAVTNDILRLYPRGKEYAEGFAIQLESRRKPYPKPVHAVTRDRTQAIGGASNLVQSIISNIICSPFLSPDKRWELLTTLKVEWADTTHQIKQNKAFRRATLERLPVGNTFEKWMTYYKGVAELVALFHPDAVFAAVQNPPQSLREALTTAAITALKLIIANERMEIDCEEERYARAQRIQLMAFLNSRQRGKSTLAWFDEDGSLTLYPKWWRRKFDIKDYWDRVIKFDFNKDKDAFFQSQHDALTQVMEQIESGERAIQQIDEVDLNLLGSFLKEAFRHALCQENPGQSEFNWVVRIKTFAKIYTTELRRRDAESSFDEDMDVTESWLSMVSMVDRLRGMFDAEGKVQWLDSYLETDASVAAIWSTLSKQFGLDERDFLKCSFAVVNVHLDKDAFAERMVRWEEEMDSEQQTALKQDLFVIAKSAFLHLMHKATQSVVSIESYSAIVIKALSLFGSLLLEEIYNVDSDDAAMAECVIQVCETLKIMCDDAAAKSTISGYIETLNQATVQRQWDRLQTGKGWPEGSSATLWGERRNCAEQAPNSQVKGGEGLAFVWV